MLYLAIISLWVVHKLINHKHKEEDIQVKNKEFFEKAKKQITIVSIIVVPIVLILVIMVITKWICKEIKI